MQDEKTLPDQHTTIKHMAHEALHDLMHFDTKLFKTISPALFKPGLLAEKTFKGGQDTYVTPFTLFVFLNFVFFIFKSPSLFQYPLEAFMNNAWLKSIVFKTQAELHLPLGILRERFNTAMHFEQKEYLVIMVPCFALLLQLLYVLKRRNFAEHLVFSLYFFAYFILLLILIPILLFCLEWLLNQLSIGAHPRYGDEQLIIVLFTLNFVHLLFAVKRVYRENWLLSALKSGLLSMMVIVLIAFVYRNALFFIVMHSIAEVS
ncbi:MAG: hypothetical protein JWP78_1337 [Mucilaginibacter sp.]|nr:hypothetical protein [Mucilaginibacter sp.]